MRLATATLGLMFWTVLAQGKTPKAAFAAPVTKQVSQAGYVATLQWQEGQSCALSVTLTPAPGYKFNKDYPSRAIFAYSSALAAARGKQEKVDEQNQKTTLSKADALELSEKKGVFGLELASPATGLYDVKAQAKFSTCNEQQCLVHDLKESIPCQIKAGTHTP